MSTVRFIEHNGERVMLDGQRVIEELRCDFCGEFVSHDDVLRVNIAVNKHGAQLAPPVQLDAHPSCSRQLGERISETVDRALAAGT